METWEKFWLRSLAQLGRIFSVCIGLIILTTIAGGISLFGTLVLFKVFVDHESIQFAITSSYGSSIPMALVGYGVSAGLMGLGYLHGGLVYLVFLRKIPNFWRLSFVYIPILILGTILVAFIVPVSLSFPKRETLGSLFIAPGLGLWLTAYALHRFTCRR